MRLGGLTARRYAILAEGRFAAPHAKTAHGLIAYGRDEIVAVIDSTLADRAQSVLDVLPNLRRDAPLVGTLREALEVSPPPTPPSPPPTRHSPTGPKASSTCSRTSGATRP